jgi:predicted nucleic acid-binding protein
VIRFVDSNILVYSLGTDANREVAQRVMHLRPVCSVQTLNESINVLRNKTGRSLADLAEASAALRGLCAQIHPVELDDHLLGLDIAGRYTLGWYDSIMLATALRVGAREFITEDLHQGQVIDGRLTIHNPFL